MPTPRPQWVPGAVAPSGRLAAAGVGFADGLWVLGGLTPQGPTRSVAIYRPGTKAWSAGPDLPLALHGATAIVFRSRLYVIGGFTDEARRRPSARVLVLSGRRWLDAAPLRHARGGAGAGLAYARLYVLGGGGAGGLEARSEVFDGSRWSDVAPIPTPRERLGVASDGSSIYAAGGAVAGGSPTARLERYDPARDAWERLADMPLARAGAGAAGISGSLVVFGGEAPGSALPKRVVAYGYVARRWTKVRPDMPNPRHDMAVGVLENVIYAAGGGGEPGESFSAALDALVVTDIINEAL